MSDESPQPAPPPNREHAHHHGPQESIKETFESIIMAFVIAFVFRAYVVEAFVIPTGSMAPTLLGTHLDVSCNQCGYDFTSDLPAHSYKGRGDTRQATPLTYPTNVICPMCRYPNTLAKDTAPTSGDRILVQKYIYRVSEPRRWDVVVFKDPKDPQKNFIKRLVGLPDESMYIFEGNLYTRQSEDAPWRIARKTTRPDVQRAIWQPIYDSRYIPRDGGTNVADRGDDYRWAPPWVAQNTDNASTADQWQIADRRSYRYTSAEPGRIAFDFDRLGYDTEPIASAFTGRYPYNQFKDDPGAHNVSIEWEPIEDVRLAAIFHPEQSGLRAALSTTARLDRDAVETLTAQLAADGTLSLTATGPDGSTRKLATTQVNPFAAGQNRELALWYVDQEASVWLDGDRVLRKRFDLPLQQLYERRPPQPMPDVRVDVAGSPVTLQRIRLARDIYYSTLSKAKAYPARGALRRDHTAMRDITKTPSIATHEPLRLEDDEFFCIGDNTPYSHDGRYWDEINPWVRQRYFEGRFRYGRVPRKLMMGRAFFVYYPGPYAWIEQGPRVFPNFGDMRFIR